MLFTLWTCIYKKLPVKECSPFFHVDQRPQIGRMTGCMEGNLSLSVYRVLDSNYPELCSAFCKVALKRQFAALQVVFILTQWFFGGGVSKWFFFCNFFFHFFFLYFIYHIFIFHHVFKQIPFKMNLVIAIFRNFCFQRTL